MASRLSAAKRGYGHRWRTARHAYLRAHPLCVLCQAERRVTEACVVDHIVPHRGDSKRFWDPSNWQPLCAPCHNRHKQREERRGYDIRVGLDGWPVDPRHPTNRGWGGETILGLS